LLTTRSNFTQGSMNWQTLIQRKHRLAA
jgi:hypothetical protein